MQHLIEILDIRHLAANGTILWSDRHLKNMLHITGEEYVLKIAFTGLTIPTYYYFGLDNRTSIAAQDTLNTVQYTEPSEHGYARIPVNSSTDFQVTEAMTGHNLATSPIVTFSASGGSWGPVRNVFLATSNDNTGALIASVRLATPRTLLAEETLSVRIGLGLKDCP